MKSTPKPGWFYPYKPGEPHTPPLLGWYPV